MEYIQRKKSVLDGLKKTNDNFIRLIKGKSVRDAYQLYKDNANKYKYNTAETKKEFTLINSQTALIFTYKFIIIRTSAKCSNYIFISTRICLIIRIFIVNLTLYSRWSK